MVQTLAIDQLQSMVTSRIQRQPEFPLSGRVPREGELVHVAREVRTLLGKALRKVRDARRASSVAVYYQRMRVSFSEFYHLLSSALLLMQPVQDNREDIIKVIRDHSPELADDVDFAVGLMERARRLIDEHVVDVPLADWADPRLDQDNARAYNAVVFAWHWTLMALCDGIVGGQSAGSLDVTEAIVRDIYELPRIANEHAVKALQLRRPPLIEEAGGEA